MNPAPQKLPDSEAAARLRVLLVPDSVYWVTGTIAKSTARFNPWIDAAIVSGPVIDRLLVEHQELIRNFELVHFTCPYASRKWLPRLRHLIPCVTSHHHVTDWSLIEHNLEGDAIIVGSAEWSDDICARGGDPARVFCVPYGVDADQFRPATDGERLAVRSRLGISQEATVVGFFGKNSSNDDDRKGIDVFASAIRQLKRQLPALTVLIVGPGWKDLVSSFRSSGVKCIWIPFIRDLEGLSGMYHALDFYWVTARVEGGPVTLLEAMSSEICCLTTAVGLAREVVQDGENAVLMPFNDPISFAETTASLACQQRESGRLGSNARATILKEMHVGITMQRIGAVYARAFENFAVRTQSELRRDIKIIAGEYSKDPVPQTKTVPLTGFPISTHRRIKMLEDLEWAEHLIRYHRQHTAAMKMILRSWISNPQSLLPPRVILRRFIPPQIVARIVSLKNGSLGSCEMDEQQLPATKR